MSELVPKFVRREQKKYPSRWLVYASCLIVETLSGTAYAFGLTSETLKSRLDLKQSQLNRISAAGEIGLYLSIIAGLWINRFGVVKAYWIGSVLASTTFPIITLIILRQFGDCGGPQTATIILAILNFFYNHGNAWLTTSAMYTVARSFPKSDQAVMLGMGKAFFGLSSALVSEWKVGLARDNVSLFMAMIAILIPVGLFSVGRFIVPLPSEIAEEYDEERDELGIDIAAKYRQCRGIEENPTGDGTMTDVKSAVFGSELDDHGGVLSHRMAVARNGETEAERRRRESSVARHRAQTSVEGQLHAFVQPWLTLNIGFAVILVAMSLTQKEVNVGSFLAYVFFIVAIVLWLAPFALAGAHGDYFVTMPHRNDGSAAGSQALTRVNSISLTEDRFQPNYGALSASNNHGSNNNEDDNNLRGTEPTVRSNLRPAPVAGTIVGWSNDVPTSKLFRVFKFYPMWMIFFLLSGGGLTFINNVAQIVGALKSDAENTDRSDSGMVDALVSVVAFCNFTGRLSSGALLAFVTAKLTGGRDVKTHHRFLALGLAALMMGLGFFVLSGFDHVSIALVIPTMLIALPFGWLFGSMIILVNELWGKRYISGNYALLDSAAMIGSLVIATEMSSIEYENQSEKEDAGKDCYGSKCYFWTFIVNAFGCGVAALLCFALWIQTRRKFMSAQGRENARHRFSIDEDGFNASRSAGMSVSRTLVGAYSEGSPTLTQDV